MLDNPIKPARSRGRKDTAQIGMGEGGRRENCFNKVSARPQQKKGRKTQAAQLAPVCLSLSFVFVVLLLLLLLWTPVPQQSKWKEALSGEGKKKIGWVVVVLRVLNKQKTRHLGHAEEEKREL